MTRTTRRTHLWRGALLGLLAGLSAGCAQLSAVDERLQELTGQADPSASADRGAVSSAAESRPLGAILADLQRGEYRSGRRDLQRYLEQHPDDRGARAVLRQLEADPERVLGHESHRYVVRAGDSYSALAARHLGDAGLFLLLARYNGADDPSDLRVGQVIRLPGPPAGDEQAAGGGEKGEPARRSLEPAPRPSAATAAALSLPDRPLPAVRPGASPPSAETLQRRGFALLEEGKRDAALAHLEAALEQEPALEPAASRVPRLREELVAEYHRRAILRYRNQELDEAIALWNRVLAIDPDFEPARSYRARARELQRRLADL